jgi:lysophospholipase L1-like esterase
MLKYGYLLVLIMVSSLSNSSVIDSRRNELVNPEALHSFFKALKSLEMQDTKTVSIIHIGDSHIQADFMTGVVRKKMQDCFGNAGRGFVFPYKLAQTNGAFDIGFSYMGDWQHCNLLHRNNCDVGMSGYTLYASSNATFTMDAGKKEANYAAFTKLTFLTNRGSFRPTEFSSHDAQIEGNRNVIYFDQAQDSLQFAPVPENGDLPDLQGIILENDNPGILYHAIGINGSTLAQYLNCQNFEKQAADLNPSLVIVSFGTNDGYRPSNGFCVSCIKENYEAIIENIRSQNPTTSILLTTPSDHFYLKKDNPNAKKIVDVLLELAKEKNVAVWNWYEIMGGSNSILKWKNEGLARGDLIHFTKEGYALQGELLYEALVYHYLN